MYIVQHLSDNSVLMNSVGGLGRISDILKSELPTMHQCCGESRWLVGYCRLLGTILTGTSTPVPGGWSSRRTLRTEESGGANRTWPRCRCTACLSCGAASSTALCCWTWGPAVWRRSLVTQLNCCRRFSFCAINKSFPKICPFVRPRHGPGPPGVVLAAGARTQEEGAADATEAAPPSEPEETGQPPAHRALLRRHQPTDVWAPPGQARWEPPSSAETAGSSHPEPQCGASSALTSGRKLLRKVCHLPHVVCATFKTWRLWREVCDVTFVTSLKVGWGKRSNVALTRLINWNQEVRQ